MENTSVRPQTTEDNWKDRALRAESLLEDTQQRIGYLEAQLRLLTAKKFGSSSEKSVPEGQQQFLFNEAEATAVPFSPEPDLRTIKAHKRGKRRERRTELLEGLPERVIEHRLPEEELNCPKHGHPRHVIRKVVSRELCVIPPQFYVEVHEQFVYGCRPCDRDGEQSPIVIARRPKRALPKSIASPSAIAYVIDQKYVMANPLYRQEKQWKRLGISLPRQTMSHWILTVANQWLSRIYTRFAEHLKKRDIIQADETGLQVLREPGKKAQSKSFMWLYRSGRDGPDIIFFEYQPSRSGDHPKAFLKGFKGILQTDGYSGYNTVSDVTRIGCFAHARRKFDEAIKAGPKSTKATKAKEGRAFCDALFALESRWQKLSPAERYEQRLIHSKPMLEEFLAWLRATKPQALPKGHLSKAITYSLNQWEELQGFLLDGRIEISNNASENSIRPFVVGRKNWLFANTPRGAKSSAIIYSIVETAKANGLKTQDYIKYLLEHLPNINVDDPDALDQLLPWSDAIPDDCRTPE